MTFDFRDIADPELVPDEWWLERMRLCRDHLLSLCDWTQAADSPVDKAEWAIYRQALRDAPASWTPGPTWDAPSSPFEAV